MAANRSIKPQSDGSEHWALAETIETPTHKICVWQNPATGGMVRLPYGVKPSDEVLAILTVQDKISVDPSGEFRPDASHGFLEDFENLDDAEDDSAATRVLTMLRSTEGGGAGTSVKIYRVKDGLKDSYCGEFTPEEFEEKNLELIRTTWGGGKYRIRIYGTPPGKRFGVMLNEVIEIENSMIPVKPGEQVNGLGMAGMSELMKLNQRLDQMQPGNGGGMGGNFKEMLSMMAMMKEVMGGGNSAPSSSVKEMIETYQMIDNLKNGKSAEPEKSEDLMSLAGKVFEMIQQNRQNPYELGGAPAVDNQAQPLPVIPQVAIPANFEQTGDDEMNAGENLMVKMTLRALLAKAQKNDDIEPIARDLADKLPDNALDMLESVLWFELLQQIEPLTANFEVWFTALRNRIIELTTEPVVAPAVIPHKTSAAKKTT